MSLNSKVCLRCGSALSRTGGLTLCTACLLEAALPAAEAFSASNQPLLDLSPGRQQFANYELLEEVGRGGMGVVYKARQAALDRIVALKMLLAGEFADASSRARLLREAKIASQLSHPNIVTIHDVGEHQGRPFLAMEYVAGRTLAEILREGSVPFQAAARYGEQLARAVHYAHDHGIIHRDLKPANVIIDLADDPKLTDFGLTRFVTEHSQTVESAGSPNFMAPEQADSARGKTGVHTDVFGLGAILYSLLTGLPPTVGDSLGETLRSVLERDPVPPTTLRPAIPRDLETIALKCLQKEPARRYGSALELADELARWRNGEPILARPVGPAEKLFKWVRRKPAIAALLGLIALTVAAGLLTTFWQWRKSVLATKEAESNNYVAGLALSNQQIEEGQLASAQGLLLSQPERLRGWEWGRLLHQTFSTLASISIYTNAVWTNANQFQNRQVLSEDASLLASWGDGFTRIYQPETGKLLKVFGSIDEASNGAAFSPDSSQVLVAGPGSGATLWDSRSWRLLKRMGANKIARSIEIFPSGRSALLVFEENQLEIWDLSTAALKHRLPSKIPVETGHVSSSGHRVWNDRRDGTQTIWDAEEGVRLAEVPSFPERYVWSAITADGEHYLTIDQEGSTAVWNFRETEPLFQTPRSERAKWARSAFLSPDLKRLADFRDGRMQFWDLQSGLLLSNPAASAWEPVGASEKFLITTAHDRMARVWDWSSGQEATRLVAGNKNVRGSGRLTRDGRFLSLGSGVPGELHQIHVWSLLPADLSLKHPPDIYRASLSPNGEWVAGADLLGNVTIWSAETGQLSRVLHGHWRWVMDTVWMPDSRHLFSASLDHTIRYWDAVEGTLLTTLTNHTRPVHKLALSHDGRILASSDSRQGMFLWDTSSKGFLRKCASGSDFSTWSLELSPDGHWLAGAFQARHGGIWNTETGQRVLSFAEPHGNSGEQVICAAFSHDGRWLVTCDLEGELRYREVASWKVVRIASTRGTPFKMEFSADDSRLFLVRSDGANSVVGGTSVEVHDGMTGRLLVSLGSLQGHGPTLSLSRAGHRMIRSAEIPASADRSTEIWDALPWENREYESDSGHNLLERISKYARREAWARTRRWVAEPIRTFAPWHEPRANWVSRLPSTPQECIDLTDFYNGHLQTGWMPIDLWDRGDEDLAALPQGIVQLGNITWDVRGVITLGRTESVPYKVWPVVSGIKGIPVHRKSSTVHFLHGYLFEAENSEPVGTYRFHYEDGSTENVPLSPGVNIGELRARPSQKSTRDALPVWEGSAVIEREKSAVRLYHFAWRNPHPNKAIGSLDFLSTGTKTVPFLVAMTLDEAL